MQKISNMRPVHWLNATQFLGAFNDNLFKWFLVFFLIELQGEANEKNILGLVGAVFVIPFLLFSDAGGVLADRISKTRIIRYTKLIEVMVMLLGFTGFLLSQPLILYTALFLMASQSAFFGPAKFGIIPELVPQSTLSKANGQLATFTFLAIIIGTGGTALLCKVFDQIMPLTVLCIIAAASGVFTSTRLPYTEPGHSDRKINPMFIKEIAVTVYRMSKDRYLLSAALGLLFFWLMGAFLQLMLIPYGKEMLGVDKETSGMLFLLVSFGIATGTGLAGRLSGRLIEFGLVPIGSFGMAICLLALSINTNFFATCVLLILLGLFAGFMNLPLTAFLQWRAPQKNRGRILATSNFLNFTGILIASALVAMTGMFEISAATSIAWAGIAMIILTVYGLLKLPDFVTRFLVLLLHRPRYRTTIEDIEALQLQGRSLIISNAQSFPEILSVIAGQQRRLLFTTPSLTHFPNHQHLLLKLMGGLTTAPCHETTQQAFQTQWSSELATGVFDPDLCRETLKQNRLPGKLSPYTKEDLNVYVLEVKPSNYETKAENEVRHWFKWRKPINIRVHALQ